MFIPLLLCIFVLPTRATVFSSSYKSCKDQCAEKNLAFPLARGALAWPQNDLKVCGYDCRVASCQHGCNDLDETESKCVTRCAEENILFESCKQGCHAVEQAFIVQMQELANTVSVSVSVIEAGTRILFEFPEPETLRLQEIAAVDVGWFAQIQPRTDHSGWKWTALPQAAFRNMSLSSEVVLPSGTSGTIGIRLAIVYRNQVVVSGPISYQLPVLDMPATIEVISQLQLAEDKVAICWKGNQMGKTRIVVSSLDGNQLESTETVKSCYLVRDLPFENCCRVSLSESLPNGGIGPETTETIELKIPEVDPLEHDRPPARLILANQSHLVLIRDVDDYIMSKEPLVIPFQVPEGDTLTALGSLSAGDLLVGSSLGSIWRVSIETNGTEIETESVMIQEAMGEGNVIAQLSFDPIGQFVYAVILDKGVLRCSIEGGPCTVALNVDSLNPIRNLVLDYINGYMYMRSANHHLFRSAMFPLITEESYTFPSLESITELMTTAAIEIDMNNLELIAVLKNGSVFTLDLVSSAIRMKRPVEYTEVSRIRLMGDRFFWTRYKCGDTALDEVCFYSEDVRNQEVVVPEGQETEEEPAAHYSRYLYSSLISDFVILSQPASLLSLLPPRSVSLIASDIDGKIAWRSPLQPQFQANEWRNVTYHLNVMPSDGARQMITTNETETKIPLRPGAEYTVEIRMCVEEVCSVKDKTRNTAFVPLAETPFILLKKSNELLEGFDVIGNPIELSSYLGSPLDVDLRKAFAIDNTTMSVYYLSEDKSEIRRSLISDMTVSDVVYSTPSIRHMSLIASRAILVLASHYQIIAIRLTGTFEQLIYSCPEPISDCGEVVGLSTDDVTGDVHFALLFPNGTVALYETDQEDRSVRTLAETLEMPEFHQLLVSHEKVVFLTADGRVGYCDKHLSSVNLGHNMPFIDFLLPLNSQQGNNLVSFSGEVAMTSKKEDLLHWDIEPQRMLRRTLFKIALHREKIGSGEKRTEVTTAHHLQLPEDLLESWSSAQKFDVNIEGITAWTSISVNRTGLQTPVKPPSAPTNTRIYATQQKTVDGARAIISFFWDAPPEWNGTPFQYIVNCTKDDGSSEGGPLSNTVTHYSFAVKSGKVSCIVAAANQPSNIGKYSATASIDSSELKPLVRLFAIDSTNALMAITNISDTSAKRKKRQLAQVNDMEYQAIAFIGNDLFAVRKEPAAVQPVLVQIDTNDIDNVVHKVSIGGDVPRVEAMTSDWVGNRLLLVSGKALYQLLLDPFRTTSLLNPKKLIDLSTGATDAKQLTFDPFKNIAYLLTRNGSLFALDLALGKELNLALAVPCLFSQTVTWMMTEFAWNRATSPKIYALTWNGLIVVDLDENRKCNQVRIDWNKFGEKGLKAMSAFAIADKLFVFVTSSEMLIYGRETVVPIPISNPPLRQILAVSQSSQPFPERSCFSLPSSSMIKFSVMNEGKTGAFLNVRKPPPPGLCKEVSFPQTHYEVYFTRSTGEKTKHIRSFSEQIHVENGILDKETDYEVTVAWLNRYSSVSGISDAKKFRTGFGYPSAPRDLTVVPVSPDTVYLYWKLPDTLNAPINEIKYKISQQASGLSSPSSIVVQEFMNGVFSPEPSDVASCLTSPCRVRVSNLRPSTEYKFWSTAIHKSHLDAQFLEDSDAVSLETTCRTKDIPGTLRPDNVTGSSILLRWNSLEAEQPPTSISVQYKESDDEQGWKAPSNASFSPTVSTILVQITNLLSATSYDYRFVAAYTGNYVLGGSDASFAENFYQAVQQTKTKAGVPTAPELVDANQDEEGWMVSWKEPTSDGGSPITSYAVEMRQNRTSEWEIAERGLDAWKLWWRPAKSHKQQARWEFRVRAANQEGFGPYASTTDETTDEPEEEKETLLFFMILAGAILGVILLLACIVVVLRYRRQMFIKRKEKADDKNCITLEKLAGYNSPNQPMTQDTKNELKNLPHVGPENVKILRQLGRGSFGEVYEGVATDLPMIGEKTTRVAVKALRQGYDESDKVKFMKEAILMNNFDHPNIVRLLGVCLDRDPLYLILELMEDGDLLHFLKNSAPTETLPSVLSLRDLLGMMIDVGRGGAYLATHQHVHRDLAARNCLITHEVGGMRVTKIADFGLARGVFNNDYYKVNGEDFLPLRWLAPESAIDGVFSTKSDVWSFGILLSEIVSLGQQPYGDMQNKEVLQHLKKGGIPQRPYSCPEPLYRIMLKCWQFEPNDRPTFSELLSLLENLRELAEFQDDRPFPPSGGHYNEAFDISQDSEQNSEQNSPMKEQHYSPKHFSGSFDIARDKFFDGRFDRSFPVNISDKKSARPSVVKSIRREKTKPPPLPSAEEIEARLHYSNSHRGTSNEPTPSYDVQSSSAYASPSASSKGQVFHLPSNLPSYAQRRRSAIEIGHRQDDGNLSSSWAGNHVPLLEVPQYDNQHSLPSGSAGTRHKMPSFSQSQSAVQNPRAGTVNPSQSYSNTRQGKVSQV